VGAVLGDGEEREIVREAAASDEAFLAIDDPATTLQDGPRLHPRGIRADLGLGDGQRRQLVAAETRGDVAPLLLRGAVAEDRDGPEGQRHGAYGVPGMAGGAELLVDDALGEDAAPIAAILLGEERAGDPRLAEPLEIVPGDGAELLAALRPLVAGLDLLDFKVGGRGGRQDLSLGEGTALMHDLALGGRIEEGLAVRDGPASGHADVFHADGLEALVTHLPMTPSARSRAMVWLP
jgi:hypothetical protein